jgi:hypothetical protein
VEAIDRGEVQRSLTEQIEPGFDFFLTAAQDAAIQLAAGAVGCWRICLSDDPRDAVPILHELLAQLKD